MQVTNLIKCFVTCLFAMVLLVASQSSSELYALSQSDSVRTVSTDWQQGGQQSGPSQKEMDGIWVGILETQGQKLRLIVRIKPAADGTLTARLDVPDQGASDLTIDSISLQGKTFRFDATNLGLSYEGL